MKNLKCVIFDVDGTITQTNELIFAAFNYVTFKYTGKTFSPSEITAMFGPPEEGTLEKIVGKQNIDAALEDFLEFYRSNHTGMARLYPGITEILEYLKQRNVLMAVFTGKGRHSTLITLNEFNIKKYFGIIITGNDVINHKPSGEGIKKILNYFGLSAEHVLMVGDAVADIVASREAGVPVAAVVWDSYGKDRVLKMDVDYLFDDVKKLKEFLIESIQHS
ncbi:MAG: HAD-IA family hydrolase [Bacteroidota bacterium]|nr:HAD-IA family hydrolase [Bacteroidota bacterium]